VLGGRRLTRCRIWERRAWLVGLPVAAFSWLWFVQDCVPPPGGLGRVPWVLYYTRSSGYFWQARYDVQDTASFLAGYEELLAEQRDYLHLGTHPPGLTVCFRGLLKMCESSEWLTHWVLRSRPTSVAAATSTIARHAMTDGRAFTQVDSAVLWLAALLAMSAAALTSSALYALIRQEAEPHVAWVVAALWPLVPAVAVFLPKSDAVFPLLAVGGAAAWQNAWVQRSLGRGLVAGLLLWLGMMLSAAFLVVILLLFVATTLDRRIPWRTADVARPLGGLILGLLVPSMGIGLGWGINLLNVWRWNLANHALFYEHNVRTPWRWALTNPVELGLAVGLPVAFLGVVGLVELSRRQSGRGLGGRRPMTLAYVIVWTLLWLSGKNMGEAARLWLFLMPGVLLAAEPAVSGLCRQRRPGRAADGVPGPIPVLLMGQLLVCLLTVFRIDGFHFTELLSPVVVESSAGEPFAGSSIAK
jgi:hypothetical protein